MEGELQKLKKMVENHLSTIRGPPEKKKSCLDWLKKVEKSCKGTIKSVVVEENLKQLTMALKDYKRNPDIGIKGYKETKEKIEALARSNQGTSKRIQPTASAPMEPVFQQGCTYPIAEKPKKGLKGGTDDIIMEWAKSIAEYGVMPESDNRLESNYRLAHNKYNSEFLTSFKEYMYRIEDTIARYHYGLEQLREENKRLSKSSGTTRSPQTDAQRAVDTAEQHKREMRDIKDQLAKALDEKNRLQMRLSMIAGIQLTHNNPDIVDLSDPNRPTKIGEKYSELYDNIWTDAIEKLMKDCKDEKEHERKETESVLVLKDIILGSTASSLSKEFRHSLSDVRKATALQAAEVLQKKFLEKEKPVPIECQEFASDCVELCWYMVVQDPPVILYVGDEKKGSLIDIERFDFYTRSGKSLDFVVWPALRLHAEGPLLRKGVVQPLRLP